MRALRGESAGEVSRRALVFGSGGFIGRRGSLVADLRVLPVAMVSTRRGR